MLDLANERNAVCSRLVEFNLEPVNAEGWTAQPSRSWDVIRQEIESSDLFVLILGDRYGWCPGNESGRNPEGLSVTHLEYQEARGLGLPVFAFFKRLEYRSGRRSKDAIRRDRFRKEVADWDGGYCKSDFNLADDLAGSVGRALGNFLTDEYQKSRVARRGPETALALARLTAREEPSHRGEIVLPGPLTEAVSLHRAVLFGGAGLSLFAGMPSAAALAAGLTEELRHRDPAYQADSAAGHFARLASDLDVAGDRDAVVDVIRSMLNPPQSLTPTRAHLAAVRIFDRIVTTNYDSLFEMAAASEGTGHVAVSEEIHEPLARRTIVKLHGSLDRPGSLVLSERDLATLGARRPALYESLLAILRESIVVFVGTSLRDPSVLRLLADVGPELTGYLVTRTASSFTLYRVLREWNLTAIVADAESFFAVLLAATVGRAADHGRR